ncbi:hypothetical protein B0H14DRAFT_2644921 [Mycena olivaceomarginata]|nr:hypothetical protein B0H14DRAFT_2644921 [Mycena olivaceomarginata]
MPPKPAEDTTPKAHWIEAETTALINGLIAKKSSSPVRSRRSSRPTYLSRSIAGIGWDDEDHHATATEEVIKTFLERTTSATVSIPIRISSLFVVFELDRLLMPAILRKAHGTKQPQEEAQNKKTSDPSTSLTSTTTPNPAMAAPNSTTATTTTAAAAGNDDANKENEIMEIDGGEDSAGAGGKGKGRFDDELTLCVSRQSFPRPYCNTFLQSPRTKASRKRARAISEDDDDDGARSHKREKSDSSSCSGNRASQRRGWDSDRPPPSTPSSDVLTKPVVTAEDMSHVDKVVEILKDHTLLPPDPRGQYFRVVSRELAASPALSRILIVEKDHTRRKALLEGILEDAGIIVPTNDDAATAAVIVPV